MKHGMHVKIGMLCAVFWITAAGAQAQQKGLPLSSCQEDKDKFCADRANIADSMKCLLQNSALLSTSCKDELERLLQMRKQAAMRGGGALSSFGGANAAGPPLPIFSYEGRLLPGKDSPRITEHRLNLSSPVYKTEKNTLALSLAAGQTRIGERLVLDSGFSVPRDLYRVELGAQFFHQLPEKKNWGLRGSIGYAGDKFSEAAQDLSFSVSASYGYPSKSEKGYWMWLVFLSNNSAIGNFVPIPGFIYIYKTETFSGMFGIPLISMQWMPVDPWMFSFSAFGPTILAEVARGHLDDFQLFANFSWAQQMYLPSARAFEDDRLSLVEQKVAVGTRMVLFSSMLAELQAGRSLQRTINLGEGFMNDDRGSIDLADDWFASWTMKYAF